MWSLKSVAITPIAPPVEDFLGGQSTFDISLATRGFGQVNAPKVALFGDDIQVEYLGLI